MVDTNFLSDRKNDFFLEDYRQKVAPLNPYMLPQRIDEIAIWKNILQLLHSYSDVNNLKPGALNAYCAILQNFILYAVTGLPAVGLIHTRFKADLEKYGLQSMWSNKTDFENCMIGKNWVSPRELDRLIQLAFFISGRIRSDMEFHGYFTVSNFCKYFHYYLYDGNINFTKWISPNINDWGITHIKYEFSRSQVAMYVKSHIENLGYDDGQDAIDAFYIISDITNSELIN